SLKKVGAKPESAVGDPSIAAQRAGDSGRPTHERLWRRSPGPRRLTACGQRELGTGDSCAAKRAPEEIRAWWA
ncbi:MAG: hypothetical protein AAF357_19620, partial [Verrucomicrobiota bacterium]